MVCLRIEGGWCALEYRRRMVCLRVEGEWCAFNRVERGWCALSRGRMEDPGFNVEVTWCALIRVYVWFLFSLLINPPRMRKRVTVVGSVCVFVCLSVKSHHPPLSVC